MPRRSLLQMESFGVVLFVWWEVTMLTLVGGGLHLCARYLFPYIPSPNSDGRKSYSLPHEQTSTVNNPAFSLA